MTSGLLRELSADTLADKAYEAIHQAIAAGELQRGEKITERDLAARLSVSPTPVREALRRLEQDHLVERTGPRTLRVTDFPDQTLAEVAEVEVSLRVHAVRFAAAKATRELLGRLAGILEEADREHGQLLRDHEAGHELDEESLSRLLTLLRQFHEVLEGACGNPVLLRLLDQTRAFSPAHRLSATRTQLLLGVDGPQHRYAEHQALLDAVAQGDTETAAAIMQRHTKAATGGLLTWH